MFLRIINIYLIFKHSHQKSKPFGIEINIDLEATIAKRVKKKECKTNGVMIGWVKNRLKLAQQFSDSDNMKIDRILCLNDSELC